MKTATKGEKATAGRPTGPTMPCGWKCGAHLTATAMREHFTSCENRPRGRFVEGRDISVGDKMLVRTVWMRVVGLRAMESAGLIAVDLLDPRTTPAEAAAVVVGRKDKRLVVKGE